MNSVFKVLSSEQWNEAQITGFIPQTPLDNESSVHFALFEDLTSICNQFFKPTDYPIALEFSPNSFLGEVRWDSEGDQSYKKDQSWNDGWLEDEKILADTVLNIYSFAPEQSDNGVIFSLLGES